MFIKNCWYVAAWDHEVTIAGLFSRRVCDVPLVMWRRADGQVIALEDRCCHRGAPLSLGRREGDCVRCMYHGLKFDADGQCVDIPGQDTIPSKVRVRKVPCIESHRWIWVWMGDPVLADAGLIPDAHWLDDPDWVCTPPGYLHYDVNYEFINDNLLDFSHVAYVHRNTLGGSEDYARVKSQIERLERGLRITRWQFNIAPPPFVAKVKDYPGNVDRWNLYDYMLPGVLIMDSGFAAAGTGAATGHREDAIEFRSCQAVTPATQGAAHYFFAQPRNFAKQDDRINQSLHESLLAAFEEDRVMISAQWNSIQDSAGFKPAPLVMDSALVQFRRMIQDALQREADDLGGLTPAKISKG